MFQYRQVLVRLRQDDSDRDIARAKLMGRRKVAALAALGITVTADSGSERARTGKMPAAQAPPDGAERVPGAL